MKILAVLAAVFTLAVHSNSAQALLVEQCGPAAAPGPYDLASGNTFNCNFIFSGAAATNGSIILDFESSIAGLVGETTVEAILGLGASWTAAKLEWFDRPSNVSLGSTNLLKINAGTANEGFGGVLQVPFSGPGTPDEQYLAVSWTGVNSGNLDITIRTAEKKSSVPLPGTLALLGLGLAGLGWSKRKKV